MKKALLVFTVFVFAAHGVSAQQTDLTEVITHDAREVERELPQGTTAPRRERAELTGDPQLWTVGFSVGYGLYGIYEDVGYNGHAFICTVRTTLAPWNNWFIDIGLHLCWGSGFNGWGQGLVMNLDRGRIASWATLDPDFFSMHPYARLAYFRPFTRSGGWYAGFGCGFSFIWYNLTNVTEHIDFDRFGNLILITSSEKILFLNNYFTVNAALGLNIGNMLDISIAADLIAVPLRQIQELYIDERHIRLLHQIKLSVGYTYRFNRGVIDNIKRRFGN